MDKGDVSDLDPTRAASVFDIDVLRMARVYAEALLNVAAARGKENLIWDQLVALVGKPLRHSESPSDPIALLVLSGIPRVRRADIITKVLGGRVDDLLLQFILVMNAHQRLESLRAVAAVYHELMDERTRTMRVQVRSAVPLTDSEREQIKEMARRQFDLNPVLVETVDPAVLGGVRLQVGDRMIDATVRARLDGLKNQLLTRSSHALRR